MSAPKIGPFSPFVLTLPPCPPRQVHETPLAYGARIPGRPCRAAVARRRAHDRGIVALGIVERRVVDDEPVGIEAARGFGDILRV